MSFSDAQIAIESRFATGFTACPIRWQNVAFDPDGHDIFATLEISDGASFRASIGPNPLHRSTGVISVNVYTLKDIGTLAGRYVADLAAAIFRDATFAGITCRSPVVRNVGSHEGRYVVNMTVAFFRDEQF